MYNIFAITDFDLFIFYLTAVAFTPVLIHILHAMRSIFQLAANKIDVLKYYRSIMLSTAIGLIGLCMMLFEAQYLQQVLGPEPVHSAVTNEIVQEDQQIDNFPAYDLNAVQK